MSKSNKLISNVWPQFVLSDQDGVSWVTNALWRQNIICSPGLVIFASNVGISEWQIQTLNLRGGPVLFYLPSRLFFFQSFLFFFFTQTRLDGGAGGGGVRVKVGASPRSAPVSQLLTSSQSPHCNQYILLTIYSSGDLVIYFSVGEVKIGLIMSFKWKNIGTHCKNTFSVWRQFKTIWIWSN